MSGPLCSPVASYDQVKGPNMSMQIRYRCRNCGERFETTVLTTEEVREAERRGERLGNVHCPKCHRTDLAKGW